ncbi:unnamed protein product [Trichobilharzia regenti]|nr:unnamed protein product [Trichobilharzia regenti]
MERFRPIQEIKQPARCLSRSVSRTKNQTRSRSSSALPPIKQTYEQSDKVCDSNVGYTGKDYLKNYGFNFAYSVCQVFIKSGQHDPQTGEMYSSICTANPTITICNKYQSTQPILLKSAYICTINQNNNGNTQPDQGNESSGSDVTSSTLTGPFCPGSVDYFEIPLNDFGEISKIRLSHDGYGNYPEWLPEEICLRLSPGNANQSIDSLKMYSQNNPPSNKLQNSEEEISFSSPTTTSCEMTFPCMRWLSRYKADGSLVREIAAPGTQIRDQGRLFGRILKAYPLDIATLFQQEERSPGELSTEQTSIFNVEAVFLGRLKALTIWLEPIDTGNDSNSVTTDSGWYLEYVVIHQLSPTFDSVRSQRSVPNNSLLPSSPPTPLPPPSSSPSVTNTDSFLVKTKLSNCKDACGTYLFPCFQWLTTDVGMNSLPIKLIPASGSGALTPDLIESIMSHEKEQIYVRIYNTIIMIIICI